MSEPQAADGKDNGLVVSRRGGDGPARGRPELWDGELVRRMGSDDRAYALRALDELFRRHGRAVLSFSLHSLEQSALAAEVVHDVFAELFAHRKALEVTATPSAPTSPPRPIGGAPSAGRHRPSRAMAPRPDRRRALAKPCPRSSDWPSTWPAWVI